MLNSKGYRVVTAVDNNMGIGRRFGKCAECSNSYLYLQAFHTNITGFAAWHFLLHTQQNLSEYSSPFRKVPAACLSSLPAALGFLFQTKATWFCSSITLLQQRFP